MEYIRNFDEDGYPADDTLECVAALNPVENNPYEIVDYIFSIWHWGEMMGKFDRETGCFEISTGGWSGNESIIDALKKSFFWVMYWYQSRTGGHYWFRVRRRP